MFIRITKTDIEKAKSIDIMSYLRMYEKTNLVSKGKGFYLASDSYLKIRNGKWYSVAKEMSGRTALSYLTYYHDMNYLDAVRLLIDGNEIPIPVKGKSAHKTSPTKTSFQLPMRHCDNFRVIAYLQDRGISRAVIDECISAGSLYEGISEYKDKNGQIHRCHNNVFVGKNEKKEPRFASLRGFYGDFKQDVAGSDKSFGFIIPPQSKDCRIVNVFESPIDCMSHKTLYRNSYTEPDSWRLSLSGFSPLALIGFLNRHPEVEHICLCLDNDKQGHKSTRNIVEQILKDKEFGHITVTYKFPPIGKDYSETLIALTSKKNHGMNRNLPSR